jgi:hypothetical protein
MSDKHYFRLDDIVDLVHDGVEMEKAERLLRPWVSREFGDEDGDLVRNIASVLALGMVKQRERERTPTQYNEAIRHLHTPKITTANARAVTLAFSAGRCVRLARALPCPHCGRELQAYDVKIDGIEVTLICSGCHRDVLAIDEGPPRLSIAPRPGEEMPC